MFDLKLFVFLEPLPCLLLMSSRNFATCYLVYVYVCGDGWQFRNNQGRADFHHRDNQYKLETAYTEIEAQLQRKGMLGEAAGSLYLVFKDMKAVADFQVTMVSILTRPSHYSFT